MVEVIDDGVKQIIEVVDGNPILQLVEWIIPTKVKKGVSFRVEYTVKNVGDAGTVFAYVKINENIIQDSKWKLTFQPGQEMDCVYTFEDGLDATATLWIETGHEE